MKKEKNISSNNHWGNNINVGDLIIYKGVKKFDQSTHKWYIQDIWGIVQKVEVLKEDNIKFTNKNMQLLYNNCLFVSFLQLTTSNNVTSNYDNLFKTMELIFTSKTGLDDEVQILSKANS